MSLFAYSRSQLYRRLGVADPTAAGEHLRYMAHRNFVSGGLKFLVEAYPKRRIDDKNWFAYLRGARLLLLAADEAGSTDSGAEDLRDTIFSEVVRLADEFNRSEDNDYNTVLLDADKAQLVIARG